MGSDEDDLRGVSQIPGDPKIEPIVPGAPGHGEGHNSGMPLQVAAAIAIKNVMEKHHIKGRLMLWPGLAEELLGSKAFYVRDGLFKGVDACIFTHVSNDFSTGYGPGSNGMVSVEYTFHGSTAHAAGDPWDGRSALDAVELMDVGMNFRREHLPLSQRTHYVITNGGGQPNIVPGIASVWYYFREHTFDTVKSLYDIGNKIADAAAMMTDTTVEHKLLGTAAPNFGNKPMAELAQANIEMVGMPKWSADDQAFAKLVQETQHRKIEPLRDKVIAPARAARGARAHRRRLRRYRRYHVDGADHHHPLPVQYPQHDRPQRDLGDGNGDADRTQGRGGRCQGRGADRAGPDDDPGEAG